MTSTQLLAGQYQHSLRFLTIHKVLFVQFVSIAYTDVGVGFLMLETTRNCFKRVVLPTAH